MHTLIATGLALSTLTVSPVNLPTQSIPAGAPRVELARFVFVASCNADVTLTQLTLHHQGLGDPGDIERIYVADTRSRLSRATSFSSKDQTAHIRLRPVLVPQCEDRILSVLADFSPDAAAGGEHAITIASADDVISTADAVSVRSTANNPTVRNVPGSAVGEITVTYPRVHTTVSYGSNRTVGRLKLEADSVSDHTITAITLTNLGKARGGDLRNLVITDSAGTVLTQTITGLNGNTARFVFDPPLLIGRNQSRLLEVHAGVRAGSRKTIRLELEEPSDLEATVQKPRR